MARKWWENVALAMPDSAMIASTPTARKPCAYLDQVDYIWTGQLTAAAQAADPEPGEQLVGLFEALTSACRRPGLLDGGLAGGSLGADPESADAAARTTAAVLVEATLQS